MITPTPCTSPAAPFYALDARLYGAIESAGIDAPCHILNMGLTFAFCTALGLAFAASYGVYAVASSARRKGALYWPTQ